ncbi:DNA topoisomerase I, partial [Candidatus Woesebacteria bacterium]|nr:DNA topoisomerase I [Candidatus Woesebacteria bacterium]
TLGTYKDIEIIVNRGRFGPYLKYGDLSVSIKGIDPLTIKLKESIEHIKARLEELKPIGYYQEKPITKGIGRFGPYLKWENTYVAITKKSGFELETITEKQALPLLEAKIKKDAEKILHTWESGNISIQIGRWGPFIKVRGKRKFYQLPMDKNGKKMDVEDVKKITEKDIKKLLK